MAQNWGQKKQGQTSRLPVVFVSLGTDNYGELVYKNKTSQLTTVGEQLGHLNLWLNTCSYDLGPRYKKFKKLEILFKKHASKKDFGLYSQSRNVKGSGISVLGSTKCEMKLVTGVQAVMEKAIRWLKENPGFDLPAPNEWQTKKIGKGGSPDVGQFSKSVSNTTQSSTSSTTSTPSKADKSKAFCKDIGFTAGTEKFGECVLKMMDK